MKLKPYTSHFIHVPTLTVLKKKLWLNLLTIYHLYSKFDFFAFRVYTSLEDIKGNTTEPVKFTTSACEPDPPTPPKLANKNKTSITLKWNVSSCKLALEKYNCNSVRASLTRGNFF